MGALLLSPSSSLLSKHQREAAAESSRAGAAKKARGDETAETIRAAEGRDNAPQVSIPGAATSGSGAALPAPSAALGAALATSEDAPSQTGVIGKVISIPSDEEGEAGDEEGSTGSADPTCEVAGEEGPHSWENRSSEEAGESEEGDNVSVHEALSSEEEDLVRALANFEYTLAHCTRLVLEENCPFEEFKEVLEHDASFLRKRLGATAARPYFQRLNEVEGAVRQLLTLRAESSVLVDLASREVRVAMVDRDRRLNENMTLELKLSAESEQVKAEDARVAREEETVDSQFSRLSFEVERLKQVVAEAQASLAVQEKARDRVAKELEGVKSRRRLTTDSVEEKDRALKDVRETIQDLISCTEEDIRREVLGRLELRHAEEIREAELRLKSL
ncbi:spindle assembly checkpoint component MAD1-like [Asparagus officinalis]|uniref:spindle assembly checkpoint component MAD1-like n=1 Tax=Asparagus officinalis TaxID=4686 RepID=UPI00098E661D|nr:spindle assembly checkpoint component MAD1-like [Asparagus officinalis]